MQIIRVILIILLLGQLGLNAQTFDVSIDTLFLDIKDIARPASRIDLTHAVKFDNNYYCFFEEQGLYSFKLKTKHFLVVSDTGEILNNIEVPKEIENTVYFDFFIRNGSLFTKTYMDHESFKFDFNKFNWTKIREVNDRVYEDSTFAITYLDFGEWGQTTWFIDKQTKEEYIIGVNGTTVNKINEEYYLTGGTVVQKIDNPRQLKQSDKEYYYKEVEKEGKFYEGTTSQIGSYTIYEDTTYTPWSFKEPKQTILTSFVSNNQLYQLYSDSNSTFIGNIENKKLIPIQNIGKKYSTYDWYYSYRGNNLNNDSRFLKFSENNNTFGFIEIQNNNIAIHYIKHNIDSLNYLGSDGFEKLLQLLKVNPSNFLFEQVTNMEKKLGGTDMRTDRVGISHNGYYPNFYSSMDVKTKEFIKIEDKYLATKTEYLYSDFDKKVKSIFIEWSPTEQYNEIKSYTFVDDDKPEIIDRFNKKQNEIVQIITSQLGLEPKKKDRGNDYNELSWNSKQNIEIVLYGSDTFKGKKEIRMIINLK